jgi:ComF family protein
MRRVLADALSNLGREALRIVLPSWCVACGAELPWRARNAPACARCWSSMPEITGAKCRSCALPLPGGDLCADCAIDPLPVDWCEAWGRYAGALERLLYAMKFAHYDFLDGALAALLDDTLRLRGDLDFDAIVPVPMHWRRQQQRGYNQAELIARALSAKTGIRCALLLRKRAGGAPQSTLAQRERAANVRRAFAASARARGRRILIVDDICTTGETLRACARALRKEGAARVCAIAVAKAT